MNLYNLAYNTWNDLNQPEDTTASYISGWYLHSSNLGLLNNVLGTCFSGVGGAISPELGNEEAAIYSEIFKQNYCKRKIYSNLGASSIQWTEIREGDGVIRRASPTEVAKVFKDLLKESNATFKDLVQSYKSNLSFPRSNDFSAP